MGGTRQRGSGSIGAPRADGRIPVSVPRLDGSGRRRYGYVRQRRDAPAKLRELWRMEVATTSNEGFSEWIDGFVKVWPQARRDPVSRQWAVEQLLRKSARVLDLAQSSRLPR